MKQTIQQIGHRLLSLAKSRKSKLLTGSQIKSFNFLPFKDNGAGCMQTFYFCISFQLSHATGFMQKQFLVFLLRFCFSFYFSFSKWMTAAKSWFKAHTTQRLNFWNLDFVLKKNIQTLQIRFKMTFQSVIKTLHTRKTFAHVYDVQNICQYHHNFWNRADGKNIHGHTHYNWLSWNKTKQSEIVQSCAPAAHDENDPKRQLAEEILLISVKFCWLFAFPVRIIDLHLLLSLVFYFLDFVSYIKKVRRNWIVLSTKKFNFLLHSSKYTLNTLHFLCCWMPSMKLF